MRQANHQVAKRAISEALDRVVEGKQLPNDMMLVVSGALLEEMFVIRDLLTNRKTGNFVKDHVAPFIGGGLAVIGGATAAALGIL